MFNLLLPDASEDIKKLKSQQSRRQLFIIGGIVAGILVLCAVVIGVVLLAFPDGTPTPTTPAIAAAINTSTPTPVITTEPPAPATTEPPTSPTTPPTIKPVSPPTTEPTQESTIEPTQQPTQEQTVEPTAEATIEPTLEPTQETTQEPVSKPTDTPTPAPLTGKIAVPVFEKAPNNINDIYNLYLASADNGWQPKLLFDRASQPAFTKDGKGIVLRSWEHKDWGQQLIYLPDFGNITNFRKMTNFIEDAHPSLNDKNVIAFHSRQQDPTKDPIIIKIGTETGSTQVKLAEGTNPDWLGDRIIFYASFPQAGLYLMSQNGADKQFILPIAKTVPATNPYNDRIAISLQKDGRWQVFTFSVAQGESSLTSLTSTPDADNYLPVWSPDGKYIAFASNRDNSNPNKWAIWVMNSDGSSQRKLFDLPGPVDGKITDPQINSNLSLGWWEERIAWAP